MATILLIETSTDVCSAALSKEGELLVQYIDDKGMNHATMLAPFVDRCMEELHKKELKLDAVAVSLGPGSYTGLRIGLSLAKGISFGLNIPLIGLSTLEIMAVKAMFRNMNFTGEEILVPMLDARRMEVYTAAYNFALEPLIEPSPLILDRESYRNLPEDKEVWFFGNGSDKAKEVITHPNARYMDDVRPTASAMIALAEKYFRENRFIDTAYSTPVYLKEYQATVPKNKI